MAEARRQTDLASHTESAKQMVERPLRSSQPTQQHVDDEVTINIREKIQDYGDGPLSPDYCIYRVPSRIRALKKEAYTPTIVSIGPFHHGNERLQDMERQKYILFKRFIERAKLGLDDLVHRVKHLEPEVRTSYSETIELSTQELVTLILLDAGFVIALLIMFYEMDEVDTNAKLSEAESWLDTYIRKDLLLIENQLPFFAIEELFNEAFPNDHRGILPSFRELVYKYFEDYNRQNIEPVGMKHFTDLLRSFYLPGNMSEQMSERKPFSKVESHNLLYNANALQEFGVKLKASTGMCLLDLKLSGRNILEIPQIVVEDGTEMLFHNMIALEQCHYPSKAYITDYAIVLGCLLETRKDVNLLVRKKIVLNYVGDSNNVASLFGGLKESVTQPTFNSEYLDIFQRLNGYCQDPWRWHQMKATLRRDYCGTPWQVLASIAAILLLYLTAVQTIFSILQVVK
ncbi:hypothetical protein QN277_023315 [Acacia crassicarpa]|uniref:Uncharacterized protein n=1 Tax=Acacia crassicarpa TaxID=499986 RepID=A0AAE1JJV9_9FABA|nr:hypothetical protein QN277_023315 [Acacia crassicarpa]